MITFVGDVHRDYGTLNRLVLRHIPWQREVIQVGDFGLWKGDLPRLCRPIKFIRGNHEHEPMYHGVHVVTEMARRATYIPDGTVLELDGRRLGFINGADSVLDLAHRRPGLNWWPTEAVSHRAVGWLIDWVRMHGALDFLVTHAPPDFTVQHMGVPPQERDYSAQLVGNLYRYIHDIQGRAPTLVCGHMHPETAFHDTNEGRDIWVLPVLGHITL